MSSPERTAPSGAPHAPAAARLSWRAGRFSFAWAPDGEGVDAAAGLGTRPLVMGIVNATPDSFSDGGRSTSMACAHAERLLREGADILDIGGESTRPGAVPPGTDEEWRRVLPVLRHAVKLGCAVSVDTSDVRVMQAALDLGVDIVNDVRALGAPGACELLARHPAAGVCLMHMQGEPPTMQINPRYDDVVEEVGAFLAGRLDRVAKAGIAAERVVLDPGFGFGKNDPHQVQLAKGLGRIVALGRPVLVGWSRKGLLGRLTDRPVGERLPASLAAALAAVAHGAQLLRVHDVAATLDAVRVWQALGPRALAATAQR